MPPNSLNLYTRFSCKDKTKWNSQDWCHIIMETVADAPKSKFTSHKQVSISKEQGEQNIKSDIKILDIGLVTQA